MLPDLFKQAEASLDQSMRTGITADMLRQMRQDAGAVVASVLGRPAGAALRLFLQGALARDVGSEASTLFLEWLARPSQRLAGPERRPPRAGLALVAAAAAIALLLLAWWAWPRPTGVTVRIAAATAHPSGVVNCGAATAFTLQGTITADRATDLTYHWEDAGGAIAKARLNFAERDSKSVTLSATTAVPSSGKGSFVLVVDSPQSQRREIRYVLGCGGTTGR